LAHRFGGGAARVEEALAFETGNERRLRGDDAAIRRADRDSGVRQAFEQVERREAAVAEARRIDRVRRVVEERGTEAHARVALAHATRPAMLLVIAVQ